MAEEFLLLNPGPVPISDRVRAAMSQEMISHRSPEFQAIYERVQNALTHIFRQSAISDTPTNRDGATLVLNGTTTLAMEAAVANLVDEDSEVLALVNGKFGRRFARIADRYARCTRIDVKWGQSFDQSVVAEYVTDEIDLVTMVHNETTTGLCNPVGSVGEIAAEHDARFVVDAAASIGGTEFRIDEWNVDIAVTGTQRAIGAPPGLSALYLRGDVMDEIDGYQAPFYGDLDKHLRSAKNRQTPFSSAVALFRALAEAGEELVEEGVPTRIERHHRQARAIRAGVRTMGLPLFSTATGETTYSDTVTAITLPEPLRQSPGQFFDAVKERNVFIAGGLDHLETELFRVSNMGAFEDGEIRRGIRVIGEAMNEAGVAVEVDRGLEAADNVLEG